MHALLSEGNLDAVELLVEAKANVMHVDKWGRYPLKNAVTGGHIEVRRFLAQNNAHLLPNDVKQVALERPRLSSLDEAGPRKYIILRPLLVLTACFCTSQASQQLLEMASMGNVDAVKSLFEVRKPSPRTSTCTSHSTQTSVRTLPHTPRHSPRRVVPWP